MNKIFYISIVRLTLTMTVAMLLTGCGTLKVAHKSEVKTQSADYELRQAEANINQQTETRIHEAVVDTAVIVPGDSSSTELTMTDTHLVNGGSKVGLITYNDDAPVYGRLNLKRGYVTASYFQGVMKMRAHIPADTIPVHQNVKETVISDIRQAHIDSGVVRQAHSDRDVKGSTSVAASLNTVPWLWALGGLIIGIFMGAWLEGRLARRVTK